MKEDIKMNKKHESPDAVYSLGFYGREKGITLIALVVTIVVLLILAGVSLNLVFNNNGIITKAGEAKIETRGAQVEDLVELYKSDNQISKYSGGGAQTEGELLQDLRTKKLVEDEEIDEENKTITIGTRVISYALPEEEVDRTALKFLVNSGNDGVVVLPVGEVDYGEGGYEVDWGDGTTGRDETVVATKGTELASLDGIKVAVADYGIAHTYPENNKEYEVTITGVCKEINTFLINVTDDKIIEVLQWGETALEYVNLQYCHKLRKIASPTARSFANINSFDGSFRGCTSLTNIPADLFANCQNVTSFARTFQECTSLTNIPAELFTNCTNVNSFEFTFFDCTSLKGNAPELWKRVPDGATNEYKGTPNGAGCFYGCSNLTNYGKIPGYWKTAPEPM